MRLPEDRSGQIYTIEGLVASLILLSVLLFILQSNSIIVPQTERSIDMKLYEKAGDTLICLDRSNNDSWSEWQPLESYIAAWDGNYTLPPTGVQPNMISLDSDINSMLPDQVLYNLDFIYYDTTNTKIDRYVIYHGMPGDNSVVSSRFITLNQNDASSFWNTTYSGNFPHVVEVKLTCWYL